MNSRTAWVLISALVLSACASGQPKRVDGKPVDHMAAVSGGKVCRAERSLRTRIRKVRCVDRSSQSQMAKASIACASGTGMCGTVDGLMEDDNR